MESFKLFPQPDEEVCTPFIYQKAYKRYTRLTEENSTTQVVSIEKKGDSFLVSGIAKEKLIGNRTISRDKILDHLANNPRVNSSFFNYVKENTVTPTFSLSLHEALVKVLVKQLISAKQAKRIFSTFIKNFGINTAEGYAFPSIKVLKSLSLEDLHAIKLGYKASRMVEIIKQLSNDDLEKPYTFLSREIKGLGPWSQAILRMELEKDYAFYPFDDLSGDRIFEECGVDITGIAKSDRTFAGDLYVYAASFLENMPSAIKKKSKKTQNIYLAYSMTNKNGKSNIPQLNRLRDWLECNNYGVFFPNSKPVNGRIAQEAMINLEKADIIVADLSKYSHGVGFEVGYAYAKGKRIILVAEESSKKTISKFLTEIFNDIVFYENSEQLLTAVRNWLKI